MTLLTIGEAIELIQMEYAEMPGLALTFGQAQRLWNLSADVCEQALAGLTSSGFLCRTRHGAYVRSGASPVSIERITSLLRAM